MRSGWKMAVAAVALCAALAVAGRVTRGQAATQAAGATTAAASPEQADHEALKKLIPIYEQAASQGKPELLKPILSAEFTGVMVTGDPVTGYSMLQQYWENMRSQLGDGANYSVTVNLAGPATIAGDMAVAHGTTHETVTMSGKQYAFDAQWTAVCRREAGQWKVLRVQAGMMPISNPFVAALVKATALKWAGIGALGGLLVGFVIRALMTRKKSA